MFKPAADGDQASCVTTTQTAQRQEVVHAVPPTAFKTTRSEYCNITKTRRWETRQRKTSQRRTAKASKPEVRPRWNEALTKTRRKGLWVLWVPVGKRANLSSTEKRKKRYWFMLTKTSRRNVLYRGGVHLIYRWKLQVQPHPTASHYLLWKTFCLACSVANLMLSHHSSFHEGLPWKKHAQALKTRTFSPHLVIFPADNSYI